MEARTLVALRIGNLEQRIDEMGGPASFPGAAARLAHARKEWAHGRPETYAVAERDIDAAYILLGVCPECGSENRPGRHKLSCGYQYRATGEQDVRKMIHG